jgi:hypothetical protein
MGRCTRSPEELVDVWRDRAGKKRSKVVNLDGVGDGHRNRQML